MQPHRRSAVVELKRIRSGDTEALGLLLEETWAPLVRYLITIVDSAEAAEDAAQEAFVRLWKRRDRWTSGSARGLVFRIGRNVALDSRRRADVRRRWKRDHAGDLTPSPPTPDEELMGKELQRCYREALESLPPRRREVFELIRLRGLSHAEVTEVLDLSYRTVANHLRLAMRDMRDLLSDAPAQEPARSPTPGESGAEGRASDG